MAKTISFGAMHMTVAFGVVYAMTGSIAVGGAVAFVEPLINTVAYFFHERAWARMGRGHAIRLEASTPLATVTA